MLVLGVLAVLVTIVAMTLVGLLFRRGSSRSFRTSALVVTVVIAALTLLGARRSLQRPSPAHYLASTAQVGFLGVSSTAKRSVDLPEGARLIESCDALGCAQDFVPKTGSSLRISGAIAGTVVRRDPVADLWFFVASDEPRLTQIARGDGHELAELPLGVVASRVAAPWAVWGVAMLGILAGAALLARKRAGADLLALAMVTECSAPLLACIHLGIGIWFWRSPAGGRRRFRRSAALSRQK